MDSIDVSYIYAAVFGSGTYKLNGRRVSMFRLPFSWEHRPATEDSVGWRWLAPVVIGYDDLSNIDSDFIGALLPDQLVTLSAMPGLELTYILNERWEVKPFFEIGGGRDFGASETFAQTHFGVRSLHKNDFSEQWSLRTGLALRWAGEYQFKSEDTTGFGIVDVGFDLRRDVPWMLFDRPLDLGTYYIYSRFLPRLSLARAADWDGEPRDLHEVGLSLGLQQVRKILGFPVSRVRVGYKQGVDFQGWTVGMDFPF